MRIAITGGGGFIGSHLADRLLADGHRVLAIDNFETGRRDNLTPHPELTLLETDISVADAVGAAFERFEPEAVAHAAASYKDPDDWSRDLGVNAVGTANVVQAAMDAGGPRIVYFQTALCYGTSPIEHPITLAHPIRPDSSYAISKTAGERYIELSGLDFVSLRLANVYGPRNLSGPLPTFYQRLSEGRPCFVMDTRRDFVYVGDLLEVATAALEGTGQGHYHVSSGSDVAISELFDAVVAGLGIELEEEVEVRPQGPGDAPSILLDPSRIESEFGWRAHTALTEGVPAAIEWYREHGVTQTYTHLEIEDDQVRQPSAG